KYLHFSGSRLTDAAPIANIFERIYNVFTSVLHNGTDVSIRSAVESLRKEKCTSEKIDTRNNAVRVLVYDMVEPFALTIEKFITPNLKNDQN
ncbi:hypothetical protein PMAYCL1PPCAC_03912, partial [Pristionchus mayeri]